MKFQIGFLVLFALVLAAFAEDTPSSTVASTPERVCEAGKEFTKDGQTCRCNAEGTAFTCEQLDCPQPQVTPVAEDQCTPGELFKDKCNECKCPESGKKSEAACTVIGCPDE